MTLPADDKSKGTVGVEDDPSKGKATEFNAEKEFKSLDGKLDKVLAGLEKGKGEDFDPIKLLRELEEEPAREPSKVDDGVPDFEKMSPRQFAEFVLGHNAKQMQQMVQPLVERMEVLRVRSEVAECKEKYSDFMEHKEAIFKLAMTRQDLSLEDAYLQVAGKSSVEGRRKVEADKRAKEDEDKKKKGAEEKATPHPFFSGERGTVSRRASNEAPETIEDAAILALREVMGVE